MPATRTDTSARLKNLHQFSARVLSAHEGLADEEGVDAVAAHEADVVGGEDAGFGNGDARLNPLPFEGLRTGRCGEAPPPRRTPCA